MKPRQFSGRWFRIYDEVLSDPKIQTLSDKLHRFWFDCLCIASKNGGCLPAIQDIAWTVRKSESAVASMVAELNEKGLLDREGTTFCPHNWDARQFVSDVSTERVKRFRERKVKRDETVSETVPEQNRDRTDTETEQSTPPLSPPGGGLFDELPKDSGSVVRPDVPARRRAGKRTTEEIRQALGERLAWWEACWKIYPCQESIRPAMDKFERTVTTRERATEIYHGIQRYVKKLAEKPNTEIKYFQGWLTDERWRDAPEPQRRKPESAIHQIPKADPSKIIPYDPYKFSRKAEA